MPKRILFVDDEANILNGLRRMLRPLRAEWEMAFVDSAPAALTMMAERPFDVLISDMRMPGMDGAQLLEVVRTRYPQTVRFVLSGYSDQEAMIRTIGLAHQILAKPCSVDVLKAAIAKTDMLCDLMDNTTLQQVIAGIDVLPALPTVHLELLRLLADPETTAAQIGQTIAQDLSLTTKVLQIINSAYFSLHKRIVDPQEAVILLGLDTVRALVNTVTVYSVLENDETQEFIDHLYGHAIRIGQGTSYIVQAIGGKKATDKNALLAGMLHDVGKLVFYTYFRKPFMDAMFLASRGDYYLYQAEREIIGVSHAEVGAYLLALWGFENDLVRAVAYHHEPSQTDSFDLCLAAVHIANGCDHITPISDGVFTTYLDTAYLERGGIAMEQVASWYAAGMYQ